MADWSRAGLAVEEFLRFVSPVQFSKPRYFRHDVELDGITLKKEDRIMAMIAAANLDQDEHRAPNSSISSGGPTATLLRDGNPFLPWPPARTHRRDLRTGGAVYALAELRLAVEPSQIHWRRRPGIRMIDKLPVAAGV